MRGVAMEAVDTGYIDRLILKDNQVGMVCADSLRGIPHMHLIQWMVKQAVYTIPTYELIAYLRKLIAGRSAIEVCAGRACLGRHLGIPMTDSYMQCNPEVEAWYKAHQQPIVIPPPDVEKLDANEAVAKYKPEVVIGAYVTPKPMNYWGPDERAIIAVAEYINIGNLKVHDYKEIWKLPHTTHHCNGLFLRAFEPDLNGLWQWALTPLGA